MELTAAFSAIQSSGLPSRGQERCPSSRTQPGLSRSKTWLAQLNRTTCILFCVSVPVLSEQMTVAEPMVSQATSCRTRLLARVILRMARASDTVTLIGSPSGTATTMMMTMSTK